MSRADKIALHLLGKGHDITVLCPMPSIPEDINRPEYSEMDIIYMPKLKQANIRDRIRSMRMLNMELRRVLERKRFDLIRPITLVPGYVSVRQNKRYQYPVMTSLTDFYSDLYQQFDMPLKRLVVRHIRRMETEIMRKTDILICDSPSQRDEWSKSGLDSRKGIALPHGIDSRLFCYKKRSTETIKKYGIGESNVLMFHGDISRVDGLEDLVDAADIMIKKGRNIKVMIVGEISKYALELQGRIKRKGLTERFIFTDRIPHFQIPKYLSLADIYVAPFRISRTSNTNITHKILEYLVMGRPAVATRTLGMQQMLGEAIAYIEPNSPLMLCKRITEILDNPEIFRKRQIIMGNLSRIYEWRNIIDHEEKIMKALVEDRSQDFRRFDFQLTYKIN